MKRIGSVLLMIWLALASILGTVVLNDYDARAQESNLEPDFLNADRNHIIADVEGSVLTLTGTGDVTDADAALWKDMAASITSVLVTDGITGIGVGAFSSLSALETATIGNTVTRIEDGAFPSHSFTLIGNYNPCGKYAADKENISLKMNPLRILTIGNSHTIDYTSYRNVILSDLRLSDKVKVTVLVPMGGRKLFGESSRGSHYYSATTESDSTYAAYEKAFSDTWDVVVVQDYQESAVNGSLFATGMNDFIAWLRTKVPGADIAWHADWVTYNSIYTVYGKSLEAIEAVNKVQNKPDFIIPASTLIENAKTTYLGSTMNQQVSTSIDCDENLTLFPILHRDDTHMSRELGRELVACNFFYIICKRYGLINNLDTFFDGLKTNPVYYESVSEQWEGDFAPETWNVLKAIVKATDEKPYELTDLSGAYGIDPIESVSTLIRKNVTEKINVPDMITEETLADAYEVEKIDAAIENASAIISDVKIKLIAPIDGTEEKPDGVDGMYVVTATLTYAYSVKDVTLCEKVIKANPYKQVQTPPEDDKRTGSSDIEEAKIEEPKPGNIGIQKPETDHLEADKIPDTITCNGISYECNQDGDYVSKKALKSSIEKVFSSKKKQIKLKWKKVNKASGYQLQYSTSKIFTKKTSKKISVKKNKITEISVNKLKSKKNYYVRIRTFQTTVVNGKKVNLYSLWSKVKKVKVK